MALLQAARHYYFNKDIDKAKSFGLNRAIFYAWTKYYGPHKWPIRLMRVEQALRKQSRDIRSIKCPEGFVEVLEECVAVSPRGFYMIGEQEQLPIDYDRQVTNKIKRLIDPEKAWKAAIEYVSSFPEYILRDPQKFYKYVYEPVRDTFFKELLTKDKVVPPKEVIERLKSLEEMIKKTKEKQRSIFDYT
ncbi:MAG: hypothetical protein J7L82_01485 [Staphylothermus sp.]|nr:hypothetical protein [Staphylothermus sp.]